MKKSLIALAVMAAAGAASAQSSVTLFGIVDTTLQWSKSSGGAELVPGGAGDVRFRVTSSGYNSSRLGFRGTEDLGGGMAASFWLEGQLSTDDGTAGGLTFQRRSTVSLSGRSWGELRIGRDYTPQFWNLTVFDPFGTNGSGTTATLQPAFTGPATVRASNSIGYFAPANLGGFYGQVQYYENELQNNIGATIDDGMGFGLRVGYASGPFNVAFGYGRTEFDAGDAIQMNLGGQWDFGMAKLMGQYTNDENGGVDGEGFLIGALVPVGAGEIRVSYSQYELDLADDPRIRKVALGYVHNLSKRTAVYATVARAKASGGATAQIGGSSANRVNNSATGLDLGIRHSF